MKDTETCQNCKRLINECDCVPLPFDEMIWVINVSILPPEPGYPPNIKLEWGWTAGMNEEEMSNLADDCPRGLDHVITGLDMAEELVKELLEKIDEAKKVPIPPETERMKKLNKWFDENYDKLKEYARKNTRRLYGVDYIGQKEDTEEDDKNNNKPNE